MSNVKLVSTPILNYYDSKLKKFLNSTYALKSDVGEGGGILYAECSTSRSIVNKVLACDGFALVKGSCIAIRFTDTSTATPTSGDITLNINGTGAKNIVPKGNNTVLNYSWQWAFADNQTWIFMYNGTNFIMLNQDNNTTYTPMALGFGYGICATESVNTAKIATLSSYNLIKGGMVSIKFTYAVPANATLNINNRGAKYIYHRGEKITTNIIKDGDIATFIYDGTQYQLIALDNESRISTNTSDIAKNAAAIEAINNTSTGILAQAKSYVDNKDDIVSANFSSYINKSGVTETIDTNELPYGFNAAHGQMEGIEMFSPHAPNPFWSTILTMGGAINPEYKVQLALPWASDNIVNLLRFRVCNDNNWCDWLSILTDDRGDKKYSTLVDLAENETDADTLAPAHAACSVMIYRCANWVNYPSDNGDKQGTIVNFTYNIYGSQRWFTQFFISPFNGCVWSRSYCGDHWSNSWHVFGTSQTVGMTSAKVTQLGFKPTAVIVFNGTDKQYMTTSDNGVISIYDQGFQFLSDITESFAYIAFR